ncbi:MAG: hypothetical protein LBH54_05885 [Clostridiales bacterium]|nr:hypothetical protein [Clostridiales bacterium]
MKKIAVWLLCFVVLAGAVPFAAGADSGLSEPVDLLNIDFKNVTVAANMAGTAGSIDARNAGDYLLSNITSTPNGLSLDSNAANSWFLQKEFSEAFSDVMTFEIRIKDPANATETNIFDVSTATNAAGKQLLSHKGSSSYIIAGGAYGGAANTTRLASAADWHTYKIVIDFSNGDTAFYVDGGQVTADAENPAAALPAKWTSAIVAGSDAIRIYRAKGNNTAPTEIEYIRIYKQTKTDPGGPDEPEPPAPPAIPELTGGSDVADVTDKALYTYVSNDFTPIGDAEPLGGWNKRDDASYSPDNVIFASGAMALSLNGKGAMVERVLPGNEVFDGIVNFEAYVATNVASVNDAVQLFSVSQGAGTGQTALMQINYKTLRSSFNTGGMGSVPLQAMTDGTYYKIRIRVNFDNGEVEYFIDGNPAAATSGTLPTALGGAFSAGYGYNTLKFYSAAKASDAYVALDNIKIYREVSGGIEPIFYSGNPSGANKISALTDGIIQSGIYLPNTAEHAVTATVVMATYKDDTLFAVSAPEAQLIPPGTAAKFQPGTAIPLMEGTDEEKGEGLRHYRVRLFAWDNLITMRPLGVMDGKDEFLPAPPAED